MQELINQIIAGTVPNEQVSDNDLREIALHYTAINVAAQKISIEHWKEVSEPLLHNEVKKIPKTIFDRLGNIIGSCGATSESGSAAEPHWVKVRNQNVIQYWRDLAEQVS